MIGKVERGSINRKRRKTVIAVIEIEVTITVTHTNLQQTNPLEMTKNNDLHLMNLRKWNGAKKQPVLVKKEDINQERKKDLKRWKLKIMTRARPTIMATK